MRRLESDTTCDVFRTHLFLGKPDTEENRAAFVSTVPLGRPSTPRDVANTCCFLASDEAEFITGVNLEVGIDLACFRSALTDSGGRWSLCLTIYIYTANSTADLCGKNRLFQQSCPQSSVFHSTELKTSPS